MNEEIHSIDTKERKYAKDHKHKEQTANIMFNIFFRNSPESLDQKYMISPVIPESA